MPMRRWRVRATPPSTEFPRGVPEEWVEVEYEPHEARIARDEARVVGDESRPRSERDEAVNALDTLHEFKALMGARILTEEEAGTDPKRSEPTRSDPKTPDGPTLFDNAPAHAARDEAIRRVDTHADPAWKARALAAVREVAAQQEVLISDDVWEHLGEAPLEPRAIGPIMLAAAKAGYIVKTDDTREAHRVVNHARPQAVWRSLICAKEAS